MSSTLGVTQYTAKYDKLQLFPDFRSLLTRVFLNVTSNGHLEAIWPIESQFL